LPVLTYHRIGDPESETRFDTGVIDATAEQFDDQLSILTQYFTVVDQDQLIAHFSRGMALPRNAVAVTFDDGYRDCHDIALPILKRHRVTATFFVATAYTTNRLIYWWDRLAYAIEMSTRDVIELSFPRPLSFDLRGQRKTALGHLVRLAKREHGLDLPRFLEAVCDACGVDWTSELERRLADDLVMTWDHVRALRDAGMDVQSHTRTHRVLSTLGDAELDDELGGSREVLSTELGDKVRAVAYPVGLPIADSPRLISAVARAGYEIGFTNASGVNPRYRNTHRFDVRRHAMNIGCSNSFFRAILAIPYLSRVRS
jgi:peptidoglycan/xylan/chitin deacetylase (PgdA/CDA1 family)